jgi:hypothetical protein
MDAARNCGGEKHDARDHQSGLEDVRCANMPLKPDKESRVSATGNSNENIEET